MATLTQPRLFLEGPAGGGKTTAAVQHLRELLVAGVRPENILILLPQLALGRPYQLAIAQADFPDAAGIDLVTIGGLARRGIELYWSLIARDAGFTHPNRQEPTFLNIETAQYYMAQFIDPALELGLFDSISIPRSRLIAQALDNLGKAAINDFSVEAVAERLSQAWNGHSSRLQIYQAWLDVARQFRQHCLENNLLDFSLQMDIFTNILLPHPAYSGYLRGKYTHLIAENIEEMHAVSLDFIRWLMPTLESAWLIYDTEAGYRLFLGADPKGANELQEVTEIQESMTVSHVQQANMDALEIALDRVFAGTVLDENDEVIPLATEGNPTLAIEGQFQSFYPQMLSWATGRVFDLLQSGVQPREIVMLAPYLNDSLRFSIMNTLERAGVPVVSHRPSRPIREEPAARAMLTLMMLTNPIERNLPPSDDVQDMFVALVGGLDPIRAALLTSIVYGVGKNELSSFDQINPQMQARITYAVGERYETLRRWILQERAQVTTTPPDYFLRRMFGDVAAQPGFGFHTNLDAGNSVAQMVDSARNFRQVLYPNGIGDWSPVWIQFRRLVSEGLLASVHAQNWRQEEMNAVFLAPAYTFLMRNRPVRYQFWLDVGSSAWSERLEQPLTHPYVVRRDFPIGEVWTDEMETRTEWETLHKLVLGLTRRCEEKIFLAIADLGEQGFEQRGPLLRIFQQILQSYGG